jgi:hypothetical protein
MLNIIKNQFKINPVRLTRLFTFTFSYMFAFMFWAYVYSEFLRIDHTDPWYQLPFISLLASVLMSYIPMVFGVVAPCAILESVVENGLRPGIHLSRNSWYSSILVGAEKPARTLCGHCWRTPPQMLLSLMFYLLCAIFIPVWFIFRLVILIPIILAGSWIVNRVIADRRTLWEVSIDWQTNPAEVLTAIPRYIPKKPSSSEPTKFQIVVENFFSKVAEVLVATKQRACPRIDWKYDYEKFDSSNDPR